MCDGGDLQEIDHFTIRKCVLPRRKSIICRFYKSKRGLWGRSSRKWLFSLSKTHSGRMFFISFLTSGPKTYHWSVLRPEVRNENVGSPLGELSAAVRIKHLAKNDFGRSLASQRLTPSPLHPWVDKTEEFREAKIWFYLHKEFLKRNHKISMI